jgi:hypothetical protein
MTVESETTMMLDQANAGAVRQMVEWLDDKAVIKVFELAGGEGPIADLAAAQMEKRNLDF